MNVSSYEAPEIPAQPDISRRIYDEVLKNAETSLERERELRLRRPDLSRVFDMETYYQEKLVLLQKGYDDWVRRTNAEHLAKNGVAVEFGKWTSDVSSMAAPEQWKKFLEVLQTLQPQMGSVFNDDKPKDKAIRAFLRWGLEKYILADDILANDRINRAHDLAWSGNKYSNIFVGTQDPHQLEYALILRLPEKDAYFDAMAKFLNSGAAVYSFGSSEYSYSDDKSNQQRMHNFDVEGGVIRNAALHYQTVFDGSDFYKRLWMSSSTLPNLAKRIEYLESTQFDPRKYRKEWTRENIELFLAPLFLAASTELGKSVRAEMKNYLLKDTALIETQPVAELYDSQPAFKDLIEEVIAAPK